MLAVTSGLPRSYRRTDSKVSCTQVMLSDLLCFSGGVGCRAKIGCAWRKYCQGELYHHVMGFSFVNMIQCGLQSFRRVLGF